MMGADVLVILSAIDERVKKKESEVPDFFQNS